MADQPVKINRLFVECSHTASTGLNTGIQRVVRKIIEQWGDRLPDGTPVHLLRFDGEYCYEIDHLPDMRYARSPKKTNKSKSFSVIHFLGRFLVNTRAKLHELRSKLAGMLPRKSGIRQFIMAPREQFGMARMIHVGITRPLLLCRYHLTRQPQGKNIPPQPIIFCKDDVLLMLDSSWHYRIGALTRQARANNATVISVIYDLIPVAYPELCEVELSDVFEDWVAEAAEVADGFIAISQTVQRDVEHYIKQLPASLEPFYGFFHLGAEITGAKGSVRPKLKRVINRNNSYLIVCTIEPRKNHHYLFETFKQLWQQGIDVNLHIVGRVGWKVDALLKEIKQHPEYQQRIFLWHDLNDGELIYTYSNAKALLFPSIIEGFGLPIIEAQHYGLPVMTSDTAIHREIGQDSVHYFDINDPQSLSNKLLAIEQGTASLPVSNPDVLKTYTWKASAIRLAEEVNRINTLVHQRADKKLRHLSTTAAG